MEYVRTLFVLWVFTEKVLWEVDYFFAHLAEYQMHIKGSKKNYSNILQLQQQSGALQCKVVDWCATVLDQ